MFFFFNDTATTEIYTLSLHDALPIYQDHNFGMHALAILLLITSVSTAQPTTTALILRDGTRFEVDGPIREEQGRIDRKSTRLNSSHGYISYAVFCLKKKNIAEHRRHL